jgi:uroporphyrinogen-III synthase
MPPILLLKTKSSPQDGYEEFFTENNYTPTFVPVLEHRFHTQNLSKVRDLFNSGAFTDEPAETTQDGSNANANPKKYGGLIFTSQRAVEGFAQMIEEGGS